MGRGCRTARAESLRLGCLCIELSEHCMQSIQNETRQFLKKTVLKQASS